MFLAIGAILYAAPLLVTAVMGVWAIVAVVRNLTLPSDLRGSAACAVCSYAVPAINSNRCPECGTPFVVGGIRTPRSAARDRGSTAIAVVAWTFLMSLATAIAIFVLGALYFPLVMQSAQPVQGVATYRPIQNNADPTAVRANGPDYTLQFTIDGEHDWSNMTPGPNGTMTSPTTGTLDVTLLVEDQPAASLVYDLGSGTPLSEDDALALFQNAGFDTDDEIIGYEARQLPELINDWPEDPTHGYEFYYGANGNPISGDEALNDPLRSEDGTAIAGWGEVNYTDSSAAGRFNSMFSDTPPVWYIVTCAITAVVLLALWAVGIWLIAWRRRLMLRTLSTPIGTHPAAPLSSVPPEAPSPSADTVNPAADPPVG